MDYMDQLTNIIEFSKRYYIPFMVDQLEGRQYILYYLEKLHGLHFIQDIKHLPPDSLFRGAVNWNAASYIFYEVRSIEIEFLSTEKQDLWRVTPYEILYTRMVTETPINHSCIDFFKSFPDFCFISDNEAPVIAYLGVGASEIKEQILLQNKNEKMGMFGQGYYFTDYKKAEHAAMYKEETDDYLLRLENKNGFSDNDVEDTQITLKDGKFYHHAYYLGDAGECHDVSYVLYYYDDANIYLKSSKPHECKKESKRRTEDGYVMRYLLFLKKHTHTKKKDYDSYAYDSTYMVRQTDNFVCLSYHSIKKNKGIIQDELS